MTPAEQLLAAADLLDKRAGEATQGVQFADEVMRASIHGLHGEDCTYFATMHPEVGKALAALLRHRAQQVNELVRVDGGWATTRHLLILADLLLAGES